VPGTAFYIVYAHVASSGVLAGRAP
jgi:hypothetical protein